MEKVNTTWVITSVQTVIEKVVFPEAVTAEEAEDLYWEGDIEDILDVDTADLQEVISVRATGE